MKALVTGATGFIGGALATGLVAQGWEVRTLVRPASRHKLAHPERYQIIEAGLEADTAQLREAVAGCDVVFHAAAIRDRWATTMEEYRLANVEGTRRLLEASIGKVRRFVYVSSVGVLGYPGVQGIDESFPIDTKAGRVGYHTTKAEAEQLVRKRRGEIEAVVSRPTITYGPGDSDGMVTRLIAMIARGQFIQVGRGTNHVHLTYIDDMVRGLILTGTHSAAPGETYILAGPRSIAVRDLVALIEQALNRSPRGFYIPESIARPIAWGVEQLYHLKAKLQKPGCGSCPPITRDKIDTLCIHRGFSSAKAERQLGYVPRIGYEEGLQRLFSWLPVGHVSNVPIKKHVGNVLHAQNPH